MNNIIIDKQTALLCSGDTVAAAVQDGTLYMLRDMTMRQAAAVKPFREACKVGRVDIYGQTILCDVLKIKVVRG
jgi:hypothetical protein